MSGLLANTVHQSPVVPSHRPGSATGSRPSKSHSYMVVTMGAVASSLGTWRSLGMGAVSVGSSGEGRVSQTGVGWAGSSGSAAMWASTALAGVWETSVRVNSRIQQANSSRMPSGSWK